MSVSFCCGDNIIIDRLTRAAESTPDKPAFFEYGAEILTWSGLYTRVMSVAELVAHAFAGRTDDAPVAVLTRRDSSSIAFMLGAVAAGAWYVPIDAELPPARITALLSVCRPAFLLGSRSDLDAAVIPDGNGISLLYTEGVASGIGNGHICRMRDELAPMFGIFTSGSTGTPKLVVKSRLAMTSFIDAYIDAFGFTGDEIFGNQIPFYFDASTKDIFATVFLGATTVIIPAKTFSFPVNLISLLNETRVSTIVWVPSALSVAAKFDVFSTSTPEYLKNVLFVGERMPVKYLTAWRQALPEARFVNLYGSTEVAGNSCYYIVDRNFAPDEILPIGKTFRGTRVFLISPGSDAPAVGTNDGSEGEICVAGDGLADGYYLDPDRTAAVFRECSFPGFTGRLYFSGDYGKYNDRGELVCVSRRDAQIKHMGHRIELGEIEAVAASLASVGEACCLYFPDDEKIVLFFSPAPCTDSAGDGTRTVRRELASRLPKYMLPHKYLSMPELPHNRNGKLDRQELRRRYENMGGIV